MMSTVRRAPLVAAALTAIALLPNIGAAQSAQRWSVQASALYVTPSGLAYEGMKNGGGLEAQVRYTPSTLSVGLGYQTSSHGLDFDDGSSETITLSGVFLEPRYVVDVGRRDLAPYIAARLAMLTQQLTIEDVKAKASGTQLNLGGGLLVRLSPRMNLDLGLSYGVIGFGDIELSGATTTVTVPDTEADGKNLVLRVGVTLGLR
jgi:opacity protein-like surface antigen